MNEALELPHVYESINKGRDETHIEQKGRCSKLCAQVIVSIILLVLLLLTIAIGLIVYKPGSERMDKIEANIAKIDTKGETNFTEQKNLTQEMSRIIESFPAWEGFDEHVSKAQKIFAFLLQKVDKKWLCREQKCYYFGSEERTWHDAREVCKRLGADLVQIDSDEENAFLFSQRNRVCHTTAKAYLGTKSTTAAGTPCQRWDYQSPHKHNYTIDQFPDDSLLDAANKCRDPSGTGQPWCYTTNPDKRWAFCKVPQCKRTCNCIPYISININRLTVEQWIGAEDINNEGMWTWVASQRQITFEQYTNWQSSEPNDAKFCSDGEDCVIINLSDESKGRWNDLCCVRQRPYICMNTVFI